MKVKLKKTVDWSLFKRVPYLCEAGMQLISVGTSRSLRIRAKSFQKCPTTPGTLTKQQLLLTSRLQPTFTYFLLELLLRPCPHPSSSPRSDATVHLQSDRQPARISVTFNHTRSCDGRGVRGHGEPLGPSSPPC